MSGRTQTPATTLMATPGKSSAKRRQNCKHQNQARGGKHKKCHPGAKAITLKNGKKPKCCHLSRFDSSDFGLFTHQQRKTLFSECQAANQRSKKEDEEKMESGILESLMSHIEDNNSVPEITRQNDRPPDLPSSVVGGRNSQDRRDGGSQTK